MKYHFLISFQTWRVTHIHFDTASAYTFAAIEGSCPDSSSDWSIFDGGWVVKDGLSASCLDFANDPSLIKPILPCN